jgi:hypothetical protein
MFSPQNSPKNASKDKNCTNFFEGLNLKMYDFVGTKNKFNPRTYALLFFLFFCMLNIFTD